MKNISELKLGYSDAENYKRRENKQLFQKFFVQNEYLEQLLSPDISFLVGEKGTGKTAYSIFLSNTDYHDTKSSTSFIRETEYQKFVHLKQQHNLGLSDYTEIWKTLLLLLFCEKLSKHLTAPWFGAGKQAIKSINDAVEEFYKNAFAPELITALQLIEQSGVAAEIFAKHTGSGINLSGSKFFSQEKNEKRFQTNLLYIRRRFEEALSKVKTEFGFIIFVDGIDIRPSSIEFDDYLDCIKGLANAVWYLNNDFFPEVKDSKGRFRTVLLIRPDIFVKIGLQNANTKLRDNAVMLDWLTTYREHRRSKLFDVVDNIFRQQQSTNHEIGVCWDHYFPFDIESVKETFTTKNSFIWFLRNSLYRPRDIITYLVIFKKYMRKNEQMNSSFFPKTFLEKREITNEYAEYLLGELRDQLSFYYSNEQYEDFLQFFEFLYGKTRFDYCAYLAAFDEFCADLKSRNRQRPSFMETSNTFLQFLYEMNVVCYMERGKGSENFIHWCFRERSTGKIAPKVKTDCTYEVHYGLVPALNMGRELSKKKTRKSRRQS